MIWFLALFVVSINSLSTADTIPPIGKLIEPKPFTIINSNSMRLLAEASDPGSGVKEVRFYAGYYAAIDTITHKKTLTGRTIPHLIGKAARPPYEFIWDLSGLPDQDEHRLSLYCDIVDGTGNIAEKAGGVTRNIVLDRHSTFPEKELSSKYHAGYIEIDGSLADWKESDSNSFNNGNDTIKIYSVWNHEYLYIGIKVQDKKVNGPPVYNPEDSVRFWWKDAFVITLDMNNNKSLFRDTLDYRYYLGAGGAVTCGIVDVRLGYVKDQWADSVLHNVRVHGTINMNDDTDTGYVGEMAFPWTFLKTSPREDLVMGFDVFDVDNDFGGPLRTSISWCGNSKSNHINPSEWGSLKLAGKPKSGILLAALAAVLALAGFLTVLFLRKSKGTEEESAKGHEKVEQAKAFIHKNFSNDQLTVDMVAREVGLHSKYLSTLFKRETGINFPQYVNNIRVQQAKKLMQEQKLNVTEACFAAGFNTLDNFERVFKKIEGVTPKEFRKSL
jgi:AraC-like DNA-binding protein